MLVDGSGEWGRGKNRTSNLWLIWEEYNGLVSGLVSDQTSPYSVWSKNRFGPSENSVCTCSLVLASCAIVRTGYAVGMLGFSPPGCWSVHVRGLECLGNSTLLSVSFTSHSWDPACTYTCGLIPRNTLINHLFLFYRKWCRKLSLAAA